MSDVSLSERVQALRYLQLTRQLLSCSADGGIAVWNMDAQREEVGIMFIIPRSRIYLYITLKQKKPLDFGLDYLCISSFEY